MGVTLNFTLNLNAEGEKYFGKVLKKVKTGRSWTRKINGEKTHDVLFEALASAGKGKVVELLKHKGFVAQSDVLDKALPDIKKYDEFVRFETIHEYKIVEVPYSVNVSESVFDADITLHWSQSVDTGKFSYSSEYSFSNHKDKYCWINC
ncbi:hypothetical protein N480_25730 [Pseudoalteromonas luteoviolacea S2607]|uniref:hypothetical protein n=1 Tax=Pseudoalteromonas luteoviolacea TaxID=43657 RepID=UPI0007B0873D|nr:hypothetical protein [Pseudoalteromonas luteoviolacea]KZN29868.1 hypothetical protein N480_25730 [Pseudoalteromonas luteoviolacea S2607]